MALFPIWDGSPIPEPDSGIEVPSRRFDTATLCLGLSPGSQMGVGRLVAIAGSRGDGAGVAIRVQASGWVGFCNSFTRLRYPP